MNFNIISFLTEKAIATTPVLLPGKSHGRRSLVGLQSMWSQRVRHDWATSLSRIGEGNGNPLQYSCLENPRESGPWWAAVYGFTQSWTRLKWISKHRLPTTQEKTLHMDITRWSTPKSDWLYTLQPKMEKPGRLQSTVAEGRTWLSDFTFTHWRRKWQPTPVFLPGESQGWGTLVGCHLWGRTE